MASEWLDPDPMECLLATLRLGFACIASHLATHNAGEVVEVPPSMFDPTAKPAPAQRNVQVVGPNQMAVALGGYV